MLKVDASSIVCTVLEQVNNNGECEPWSLTVKQFRSQLEGRTFTFLTDHKPLIYAFDQ